MIVITDVTNVKDTIMKWVHELSQDETDHDHELIGMLNASAELLESAACHMHDFAYQMYKEANADA